MISIDFWRCNGLIEERKCTVRKSGPFACLARSLVIHVIAIQYNIYIYLLKHRAEEVGDERFVKG